MEKREYMDPLCPFDVSAWRKPPAGNTGKRLELQAYLAEYDEYMARGEKEAAGAVLRSALTKARELSDRAAELSLCSELMGYCRQAGQKEEGMEAIENGLRLLRELGLEGTRTAGTILINAATALSAFGEHRRALGNFQEAFRCYNSTLPPEDLQWAALMNNMAAVYEALGERESAERYYRGALQVQQRHGGVDTAVTHVNLAQLLDSREEWDAALEALNDPELIWDSYYAFTCRKCAAAFAEAGMHETARELLERSEVIHEST